MLHLLLRTSTDAFRTSARSLAEQGLWTWPSSTATADPSVQRVELPIGDATLALGLDEVRSAVAQLAGAPAESAHVA